MATARIIDFKPKAQLQCSGCGVEVNAGCDCGVPYLLTPVERTIEAIDANPGLLGLSNRAIAKEIGVGHETVRRTRKATASSEAVDGRVGLDGKKRKMPKLRIVDTPSDPIVEPCPDCSTQEEEWQRGLTNMAADAVSLPAFWTRQFGEDWNKFKVTREMVTLAEQASTTWTKLAVDLKRRKEKAR